MDCGSAAAVVLLLLPKLFSSGGSLTTFSLIGISIIFSLSYNILLGQTGMLSFGHAVYYGLGGFLVIHAINIIGANKLPIPLPLVPLIGGLTGLTFAVLLGWVSTQRSGTAFAMISLGVAELVASSALILRTFFGGEAGISANRTKVFRLFDWSFGPQIQIYYLVAAWTLRLEVAEHGPDTRDDVVGLVRQPGLRGRDPVRAALEVLEQQLSVAERFEVARPQDHGSLDDGVADGQQDIARAVVVVPVGGPLGGTEGAAAVARLGPPHDDALRLERSGERFEVLASLLDHMLRVGAGRHVARVAHVFRVVDRKQPTVRRRHARTVGDADDDLLQWVPFIMNVNQCRLDDAHSRPPWREEMYRPSIVGVVETYLSPTHLPPKHCPMVKLALSGVKEQAHGGRYELVLGRHR